MMRKLVLNRACALGEGTREAGEVLAYIPPGVDPREVQTLFNNPAFFSIHNAPELDGEDEPEPASGDDAGDDAAGDTAASQVGPARATKPRGKAASK